MILNKLIIVQILYFDKLNHFNYNLLIRIPKHYLIQVERFLNN